MNLTYKDAIATLSTLAISYIAYAMINNIEIPYITSWRKASILIFAIGLATCIFIGSGITSLQSGWATAATVLGVTALFVLLNAVVLNSRVLFILLTLNIVSLWALSTIHHIVESR